MSESVDIVIKAQNQATGAINAASDSMKTFGQTAQRGASIFGAFNQVVGANPFSQMAAGIGNAANQMIALRQSMQQGEAAGLAMKAAVLGIAGVIAVQLGQAIAELISNTEIWKQKVDDVLKGIDKAAGKIAGRQSEQFKEQLDSATASPEKQDRLKELADEKKQQIAEQRRKVREAREAADATAGAWTEAVKKEHEIDKRRLEIEQERLSVLRDQAAEIHKAQVGKTSDADNRKKAEEMWQKEAAAHAEQQKREKNAADGARRLREELQDRFRKIRDDGNEKQRESDRQGFIKQMEWEFAEEDKYIEESNKKYREKVKAQKESMKDTPQWQAFESRMLSRGTMMKPEEKVAKNTEEMNKKLERQAKQQEEANKLLLRIAEKTGSDLEGF